MSADELSSPSLNAALHTDVSVSKATTATVASGSTVVSSVITEPLRIGTTTKTLENARLVGLSSSSSLQAREATLFRRRHSETAGTSTSVRTGSVSPLRRRGSSTAARSGGSSISSLEDVGEDILTDKMGFLELNLRAEQEMAQKLKKSVSNLPAVNERLRDETLEDCHAFKDLKRGDVGTISRGGSIMTGGEVDFLEPLTETEESFAEGDESYSNPSERTSKIKITNLAEILEAPDDEQAGEANGKIVEDDDESK